MTQVQAENRNDCNQQVNVEKQLDRRHHVMKDRRHHKDGNPVEFKASAAIPRIYRNKFGRDVYKDLMVLNDAIKDQNEDASTLDGFSLEMFEDLAFVMWSAAHPEEKYDSPDEWLDQFNTFSIYQILPELIDLWGMNIKTTVSERKN